MGGRNLQMSAPVFSTEANAAGAYPSNRFGKRERKLLESVQDAYPYAPALAGNLTSVGGAASEAFTVTGLLSTDVVVLTLKTNASDHSILAYIPATDSLTIRFDSDPGAGTIVSYVVFRAR